MKKRSSAGKHSIGQCAKKAEQEKRTIIGVDEAGFSLLPMIVRTSARRGQTPVLRLKLTRDHLSALGGITPQGRLFMQMQARASNAEDVVRFVRLLFRTMPGPLLIIWDGSHSSGRRRQTVPRQSDGPTRPSGTLAWLRSGGASARTGVERAQTPRTQASMVSRSGSPASGTGACQRAPSPSAEHSSALLFSCSCCGFVGSHKVDKWRHKCRGWIRTDAYAKPDFLHLGRQKRAPG